MPSHDEKSRDPQVDAYINEFPNWQRELCQELRELIGSVDPQIEETVKRRVQPYFVCEGNVCALLATKDHVNLFLYDGAIVPDPEGVITGGHDNETARTVAFFEGEKSRRAQRNAGADRRQQSGRRPAGAEAQGLADLTPRST